LLRESKHLNVHTQDVVHAVCLDGGGGTADDAELAYIEAYDNRLLRMDERYLHSVHHEPEVRQINETSRNAKHTIPEH
jgi:hypothetical protein